MPLYNSILELVGHTPTVRLNRLPDPNGAQVYVKLEGKNPAGSVKDRPALNMILQAEKEGKLIPGKSTVIEATSGNTGIGLAMVCAARGYRCIITMPENATEERVKLLKAYGAEVYLTPEGQRMTGAIKEAEQLAASIPHSFIAQQFDNPANPDAHRGTTAVEIHLKHLQKAARSCERRSITARQLQYGKIRITPPAKGPQRKWRCRES